MGDGNHDSISPLGAWEAEKWLFESGFFLTTKATSIQQGTRETFYWPLLIRLGRLLHYWPWRGQRPWAPAVPPPGWRTFHIKEVFNSNWWTLAKAKLTFLHREAQSSTSKQMAFFQCSWKKQRTSTKVNAATLAWCEKNIFFIWQITVWWTGRDSEGVILSKEKMGAIFFLENKFQNTENPSKSRCLTCSLAWSARWSERTQSGSAWNACEQVTGHTGAPPAETYVSEYNKGVYVGLPWPDCRWCSTWEPSPVGSGTVDVPVWASSSERHILQAHSYHSFTMDWF